MTTVAQAARRLVEKGTGHRVISLYLDLDPERFATAPARATQIHSLIDEAAREIERQTDLAHEDRIALREDVDRLRDYLLSREPPFKGAQALAVFCSSPDGLFETVQLPRPSPGRVVIGHRAYVEPMLAVLEQRQWCVVLISRRTARMLTGPADQIEERGSFEDDVHGQHDQGGWSQARYERSVEKDVDDHLRRVAEIVARTFRSERFDRLALGGPPEIVPRFEGFLPEEIRACVAPGRVEVDVSSVGEDQVRTALSKIAEAEEQRSEREALERLAQGIGSGGRAAGGLGDTVEALNERRVQTLLLAPDFDGGGHRCPACRLLILGSDGRCPADGTELEDVEHLREAVVEAGLGQDADIMVVRHYPDLGPFQGIAALLRF